MLNDTPARAMTILRPTGKGQRVGSGPTPENPGLFPKIVGIIIPLTSLLYYLTQVLRPLIFWDGPTLPTECVFPMASAFLSWPKLCLCNMFISLNKPSFTLLWLTLEFLPV